MILLATIWFLLVKPEATSMPQSQLKEFEVDSVQFGNQADCENYGRLWSQKHATQKRGNNVAATYTCISRER